MRATCALDLVEGLRAEAEELELGHRDAGRCTASPTAEPTITPSASGMSTTRASPKRSWSPSVARNTPPLRPMSWPSRIIRSSRSISRSERAADRLDHVQLGHLLPPSPVQRAALLEQPRRRGSA